MATRIPYYLNKKKAKNIVNDSYLVAGEMLFIWLLRLYTPRAWGISLRAGIQTANMIPQRC